jgi:hypothetical protein
VRDLGENGRHERGEIVAFVIGRNRDEKTGVGFVAAVNSKQ